MSSELQNNSGFGPESQSGASNHSGGYHSNTGQSEDWKASKKEKSPGHDDKNNWKPGKPDTTASQQSYEHEKRSEISSISEDAVNPSLENRASQNDEISEAMPDDYRHDDYIEENDLEQQDHDYRDGENQSGSDQDDGDELREGK